MSLSLAQAAVHHNVALPSQTTLKIEDRGTALISDPPVSKAHALSGGQSH